jgi:hypothetical protein
MQQRESNPSRKTGGDISIVESFRKPKGRASLKGKQLN